ncbi:MAG: Uncharacterised protein [Flavobacteriales bacterium UBA4585]|nr:MAG: Uncharacterised protein [Flavobacteriales bacterium UBA4585]
MIIMHLYDRLGDGRSTTFDREVHVFILILSEIVRAKY